MDNGHCIDLSMISLHCHGLCQTSSATGLFISDGYVSYYSIFAAAVVTFGDFYCESEAFYFLLGSGDGNGDERQRAIYFHLW